MGLMNVYIQNRKNCFLLETRFFHCRRFASPNPLLEERADNELLGLISWQEIGGPGVFRVGIGGNHCPSSGGEGPQGEVKKKPAAAESCSGRLV